MSNKERRAQSRREAARLTQDAIRRENIRSVKLIGSTIALTGAGLFAQSYNLHGSEILSSYGKDFLGPVVFGQGGQLLATTREALGRPTSKKLTHSPTPYIALALAISYLHEGMQFYASQNQTVQEQMEGGRFDPIDLAVYAVGAVFAYRVSKWVNGSLPPKESKSKKKKRK